MQANVFKKSKGSWLQQFFTSLSSSAILCQPIENTQVLWKNPFEIQSKNAERMLYPPDIHLSIDPKLTVKFKERMERARKSLQGVIIAERMGEPFSHFVEFKGQDQEDLGALQEAEGVFCVGVSLSKGEGDGETAKRVREELRRCAQRSGAIYSQTSKTSQLSQLTKLMLRQIRLFLIIDDSKDTYSIGRLMFYPKVNIPLRKVKVEKVTFIQNAVLEMILKKLNYKKQLTFGYITLNKRENYKFVIMDRNDPDLQNPPLIGVWVAGYFKDNKSKLASLWSMIMEYITNPQIKRRYSLQGDNSGLLMVFDSPTNVTQYLFDFPTNSRWGVCSQVESCAKIPEEHNFCQQEVIMEQEKEESEVESISSKQDRLKQGYEFQQNPPEPISTRLLEEKDAEIRRLKVELEFYKNQSQKLQEELNNLKVLQLASKAYVGNQPPPYGPFRSPPQQQEDPFSFGSNDPPFFGKKSEYKQQECSFPLQSKQFAVRDMKNISFAQENSFDDDNYEAMQEKPSEFRFTTPDFKDSKEVKPQPKEIKSFNFKKSEENRDDSNIVLPKNSRIRSLEEKEELTSKEKPEDKVYSSANIRSFQEKYGTGNNFTKTVTNSPKVPQKSAVVERQERSAVNLQKKVSRDQPPKKPIFQEQPRDKRIKNQLYPQEKSPSKKPLQPIESRPKQPLDSKSQQPKNLRQKSPLSPAVPPKRQLTPKPILAIQSDDQDDQLKNIIQKRGKKK